MCTHLSNLTQTETNSASPPNNIAEPKSTIFGGAAVFKPAGKFDL